MREQHMKDTKLCKPPHKHHCSVETIKTLISPPCCSLSQFSWQLIEYIFIDFLFLFFGLLLSSIPYYSYFLSVLHSSVSYIFFFSSLILLNFLNLNLPTCQYSLYQFFFICFLSDSYLSSRHVPSTSSQQNRE